MSWSSLHIASDDEIHVDTTTTPGYVHLSFGVGAALMMPIAKADELHVALGEALTAPREGGAPDA